jgi:hypothetical protein
MTQKDPLKDDFKAFLWALWRFLRLPPPTPVQYDIADYLQYGPKRQAILAFRGVGKSWITSAYVLWCLYCDPQERILVVSATKVRSDDFSTFCMRILQEWPILKHLRPKEDQRQSKISFDVAPARADHAPSVKSASITGQIAGSRASKIVADDIEIPGNSDTENARAKLKEAVKEFDAVLKPGGSVLYLGTPQCEMSLYNELPERGYQVRIWPAELPQNHEKYGSKLAPMVLEQIEKGGEPGDLTDGKRFSLEDLGSRKLSYGRAGYALQFMLDTSLADADRYPLRLKDLICLDLNEKLGPMELVHCNDQDKVLDVPTVGLEMDKFYGPMWTPGREDYTEYEGTVMFIDPSGRGKDETAFAIVSHLHGRLFVHEVAGYRGGYNEELLKRIAKQAKRYGVNRTLIEPNFGDGMFAQVYKAATRDIYNCTVEDAPWARVQKEARIIDTLEPVMSQHRLVIDKGLIERDYNSTLGLPPEEHQRYRLFYQMTRLTSERGALQQDDRLDALAGAVAYWLNLMAVESREANLRHRSKMLEEELARHIKNAVGRDPRPRDMRSKVLGRVSKKTPARGRITALK